MYTYTIQNKNIAGLPWEWEFPWEFPWEWEWDGYGNCDEFPWELWEFCGNF